MKALKARRLTITLIGTVLLSSLVYAKPHVPAVTTVPFT